MTNNIKSFRIFIFVLFPQFLTGSSDVLLKLAAEKDVHESKGALDLASDTFKQVLENLGDLDFYTSTSLSVVLPGTGKALTYDWKEAGSGDIFIPFQTIKPVIKPIETKATAAPFSATDLVKTLLENEALKKGKKFSLTKNFELTPLRLFILKMALLAKYAYIERDASTIISEVLRMVVKLSLVEDNTFFDRSKTLSSYLPEVVTESLNALCPGLTEMLDEVWTYIMTEQPDQLVIPVQAHAYLFKDAALADECFALVQNSNSDEFEKTVEAFVAQKKCQLCPVGDVKKFKGAPLNALTKKLVGKYHASDISTDTLIGSIGGAELIQDNEHVFQYDAGGNEFWIISSSSDMGFFVTLKQILRVLIMSVKELIRAKQEFAKNNPGFISSRPDVIEVRKDFAQDCNEVACQLTALTKTLAEKQANLKSWEKIQQTSSFRDAEVDQIIKDLIRESDDLQKKIAYQHEMLRSLQDGLVPTISVGASCAAQGMILLSALRDILAEFTSEIPQVVALKKTLINTLADIVTHSQHIKENSGVYRYIIMTSFPEFLDSFDEAVVA